MSADKLGCLLDALGQPRPRANALSYELWSLPGFGLSQASIASDSVVLDDLKHILEMKDHPQWL